jgi:glucose-1-phosphate thymidylyltransferase
MKGIILAGGKSSRLLPVSKTMSKQLMPIFDKPLVYYPLSILMLSGIKDILIITSPDDNPIFKKLFSDGRNLGINIEYAIQEKPNGIAEAFIIGEEFIGNDSVCLILGDNIFFGQGLSEKLQKCTQQKEGATVFGYYVDDPERYGVIEFDKNDNPVSIVEKPQIPKSNYAVVGLYYYDNQVIEIAKSIKSSDRGELEITSVNNIYLERKQLKVEKLGRGYAWLDTGTHQSMLDASLFIKTIEERQNLKIGCIEEVAYRMRYIDKNQLETLAKEYIKSNYGKYLMKILEEEL